MMARAAAEEVLAAGGLSGALEPQHGLVELNRPRQIGDVERDIAETAVSEIGHGSLRQMMMLTLPCSTMSSESRNEVFWRMRMTPLASVIA